MIDEGGAAKPRRTLTLSVRLAILIAVLLVASAAITTLAVFRSVQSTMLDESNQSVSNIHSSVTALVKNQYDNIEQFRTHELDLRKARLEDVASPVVTALDALRAQVDLGTMTELEAKDAALEMLRNVRFGNKDYFFTYNRDLVAIAHPDPKFQGKDLSQMQDADGVYVLQEIKKVALDKGSGFVPYRWVRLDEKDASPKIGYVFHYAPWDWIIGTGVYVDDIDKAGQQRLDQAKADLATTLENVTFSKDGFFFILNQQGEVVVSPTDHDLSALSTTDAGKAVAKTLVASAPAMGIGTVTIDASFDGSPATWYTKVSQFAPLGWVLVSAVPQVDLESTGRTLALQQVGLAAVVLLIGLAGGVLVSRRIVRPVEQITRAATDLGKGTFDPSGLDKAAARHDEVGTLARTFQTMAVEVQERERALREQVRRLTVEIDRTKVEEAVSDITESDYFQRVKEKADEMRRRRSEDDSAAGENADS